MNNVYVLNPTNFSMEGIIDSYVSCIWRPSYSEVGDFELYLGATKEALDLLQLNHYLVRGSDIEVDSQNKVTYRKVMIIKNIELVTDVENGNFLTVTGRELKYILHQRIVWDMTNLGSTAELAIKQLVGQNAINPTDTKRKIPNLILGDTPHTLDRIVKQVTGDNLDTAIIDICITYNYGWDIYIYDGDLIFTIYLGLDRSYDQTDRPYVVFSDSFENLYNTDYQVQTEEYANCTLIGGTGEGTQRIYTTVGNSKTGLDRFEIFTDARDISRDDGTGEDVDLETYKEWLQDKGKEVLASLAYTEGFSGEVLSDVAFRYGTDFDLGDIVTVINEYGITKNVRVLSAIESEDETGTKLLPQFNI